MTYEYAYEVDGVRHVVERDYPMGKQPAEITVTHEGKSCRAFSQISGGAGRMSQNWARWQT